MSYQVLARKYRPSTFKELEGQEHVLRALINALDKNRLHHAYLFAGTRGVGKTTIARILAKCLNCENGVTSEPCGACGSCLEIGEGRSVDLIEVDAASRTGVDDMRELLDNVQYMPTASRFKVYLIDEVHMLSKNAFNAMLKTLEEPPEHVKFLFATTDPKKLPVTVLSRCLQFNLKNLSPERIVNYLTKILPLEAVDFEENALWQLGRAADGSMRDALSLTDQAISFSDNSLTADTVKTMLGSIDQQEVYELLDALISKDGERMLQKISHVAQFAPDYMAMLDELLGVLHRIAIAQAVPAGIDNSQGDRKLVLAIAEAISREEVQLFYQIGLIGKRDLPLAPDPRSGFEMILLRMLSFTPNAAGDDEPDTGGSATGGAGSGSAKASPVAGLLSTINSSATNSSALNSSSVASQPDKKIQAPQETEQKLSVNPARAALDVVNGKKTSSAKVIGSSQAPEANTGTEKVVECHKEIPVKKSLVKKSPVEDLEHSTLASEKHIAEESVTQEQVREADGEHWHILLAHLALSGVTHSLATNCILERQDDMRIHLKLSEHHASMWNKTHEARISQALTKYFGRTMMVSIEVGTTEAETPAMIDQRQYAERHAKAVVAIENDENIKKLIQTFGATLNRESIEALGGQQP
ncbi:MAG: DNA polymerase III subunit gamma/tau [Pseudomonadales bacterium]